MKSTWNKSNAIKGPLWHSLRFSTVQVVPGLLCPAFGIEIESLGTGRDAHCIPACGHLTIEAEISLLCLPYKFHGIKYLRFVYNVKILPHYGTVKYIVTENKRYFVHHFW